MNALENQKIARLEALGIEADVFDADEGYDIQREKDVSEATLCILDDLPIPKEVEERLLAYKTIHG